MSSDLFPAAVLYRTSARFYNLTGLQPADGHCEWKQFGYVGPIAEPGSLLFAIMTALQGIFGLWKSQNVTIGSRYMFSLLLGYGLASMGNAATLWSGYDKMSGCFLDVMQAVIIVRLINTLKFAPFNFGSHYHLISALLMSTLGLYPIIANTVGSSMKNPWI